MWVIYLQKLQDKRLVFKGEITVFLSLIFILLLSFVGTMVEAASITLTKSMKRADMALAMESIFAEYEPELLEKYGIFAKQGSDLHSISNRLSYYGSGSLEHEIVNMELLSDMRGQEVYRQAVISMGGSVSQTNPSILNPYEEEAKSVKENFESLGVDVPELEAVPLSFLLALVLPKEEVLSNKTINLENLPSKRELRTGIGDSQKVEKTLFGKGLLASYFTMNFRNYTSKSNADKLSYETEYLLAGKSRDKDNLEWVAKRLLTIRVAVNYGFLLVDEEKLAKAEAMAIGISTVLAIPEAKAIIKQAVLFFWSYEESLLDLKKLFLGERVPLGRNEAGSSADYEDYLRALLFAADTETLCMRTLDLIELNLGIQVDRCVTKLELESRGYTRRQIPYTCNTSFAYK